MVKKLYVALFILLTHSLHAQEGGSFKKFDNMNQKVSANKEAKIFTITGSVNNISLSGVKVAKPNAHSLKQYGLISRKDKYAIKVLNKKGNQIMFVGLGDPFTIHIDHIGYEDEMVFQGNVSQDFEIALPVTSNAEYFVLLSQDEFGFKEIKKIKVK